jgi:hypothetical protein
MLCNELIFHRHERRSLLVSTEKEQENQANHLASENC